MRQPHIRRICLFISLAFLPANAFANIPLPFGFAFGLPVWIAASSLFLSFAGVLLIETAILKWAAQETWGRAFLWALKVNLITTAVGAPFLVMPFFTMIGVAIYAGYLMRRNTKWNRLVRSAVFTGLLVAGIGLMVVQSTLSSPILLIILFYLILLFSFLLTLLLEGLLLSKYAKVRKAFRWSFAANGGSYCFLLFILLLAGFRSGVLDSSLPIMSVSSQEKAGKLTRMEALIRLEEIYRWEQATARKMFFLSRNPEEDLVLFETQMLERWIRKGYREDAQSLYDLISTYRKFDNASWGGQKLKEARKAIDAARSPRSPEKKQEETSADKE